MQHERIAVLIFLIFDFLLFSWAALFYFRVTDVKARLAKNFIALAGIFGVFYNSYCIYNVDSHNFIGISSSLIGFMLAGILFYRSIEALKKHKKLNFAFSDVASAELCVVGPYRFVRHPIYLAYSLYWIASTIAARDLISFALTCSMITLYVTAAVIEEKQFKNSHLSLIYEKYKENTGLIFPKLRWLLDE